MKRMTSMFTMSALVLLIAGVACRHSQNATADSSLSRDLALAAHQRDSLDSISTLESARLPATAPTAYRSTRVRSGYRSGSAAGEVSRTRTVTRSSGGTEVKHTKRDAAIGAAAGAVIGATTSRNKVKGGVIGAAVGGILGAVIGNNVDKTRKKP
jgi:uncharacterized protein YcfJ